MPFFVNVIVSTALGVLSGLGVGGGSLLIVWLTLVCKLAYGDAKYLNLLSFIPAALISVVIHLIRGKVSLKRIFPATLAGCLSAVGFTMLSSSWDTDLLRKLFGGLLLFTAVRELRCKKQQSK